MKEKIISVLIGKMDMLTLIVVTLYMAALISILL